MEKTSYEITKFRCISNKSVYSDQLANSVEKGLVWELNSWPASKEIPTI
jgi:hypothetical protein